MTKESMGRVYKALDRIDVSMRSMEKTLAAQAVSIGEHIRRTELAEKRLEIVESAFHQIQGIGKLLAYISSIATILGTIYAILQYVKG